MQAVIDTITAHSSSYRVHNPGGLIGRPIAEGRPYEQVLLEAIHADGFTGTAVDAGAHVGNHTLWLAAICGLRVEAFEPLHHERLQANVELNQLEHRVTVHPVALGAEAGVADLVGKDKLNPGAGPVSVAPLDSFGLTGVSVIKVDVEDMEPAVLLGGEETIRRDRPVLFLEARDASAHDAIDEVLRPWRYRFRRRYRTATPVERWEPR